jgi:site-specific DNA recombinase
MFKAVTYVRVSSREQQELGNSLSAQKRLLWDFARNNGYNVIKEFEEAETAKEAGRKEFNKMLAFVRQHGIKFILVEKTDRLHRNFRDYVTVEELIKECSVTVHLVKEGQSIGTDSKASDKLMHGLKTVMAKGFIDNLKEEVDKGIKEKLRLGEYPHQAPLGYLNAKDPITKKSIIIIDEKNKQLVEAIFNAYASGQHSLKSIAQHVEDLKLTNNIPIGRCGLKKSVMSRMLHDPFYIGKFMWQGKLYDGKHVPLVSLETWQTVQDVLSGKNLNKCKRHNIKPFVYKGVFACGECDRTITAEIKKEKYVYYRCTKFETVCSQKSIREEAIDIAARHLLDKIHLSENGLAYVVAGLKQSLEDKRSTHDKDYDMLVREHSMLKNRLDKMYEDKLDGRVSDEFYDSKYTEYKSRLDDLTERIALHNKADTGYYEFGRKILELAKNAGNLFEQARPEEKRELLQFLLSNSKIKDSKPDFTLKQPFFAIAKHSSVDECSAWQGRGESNPR